MWYRGNFLRSQKKFSKLLMNGLKALIQLLIYMLNIPKENNVFTETTSCSDKKKKKIQSSLSQMQGHYFHQTMTVILCVSGVPDH